MCEHNIYTNSVVCRYITTNFVPLYRLNLLLFYSKLFPLIIKGKTLNFFMLFLILFLIHSLINRFKGLYLQSKHYTIQGIHKQSRFFCCYQLFLLCGLPLISLRISVLKNFCAASPVNVSITLL